ncbi:MAG: MBOAT family O-acyltransferase [Candidatus Falkowbacteria bacterium]
MLFNSLAFLIFFPAVAGIYFLIPHRWRIVLLLLASCYFYMAFVPKYILILGFLITLDYFLVRFMDRQQGKYRKFLLFASLTANIGVLFIFKYFNFFNANIALLADFLHWNYSLTLLRIALPLGLSFHIFQSLSYVIEVYKGKYEPEKNYLNYAIYVMFFPQLVAGPIERPHNLLPQFRLRHDFDGRKVSHGLERMLWGFFKKVVIADWLSVMVDMAYNAPQEHVGPFLVIATIFFAFQIYCDFSGYTDIALGAAEVLGFRLMENFNRPYAARSIADFWKRWHISLSSWFRDYVYIPLGGNRVPRLRRYLNLLIVFVLSGLWHGANWTFVIWGALHGLYLIMEILIKPFKERFLATSRLVRLPRLVGFLEMLLTFVLVNIAWIFFRANSVADAFYIITNLGKGMFQIANLNYLRYELFTNKTIGLSKSALVGVIIAVIFMETVQYYQAKKGSFYLFETNATRWLRFCWYYALILSILFFGHLGGGTFIYFQF